jgi:MFS family permease
VRVPVGAPPASPLPTRFSLARSWAYLLFTTTDGAIRMIVLLHAYQLGFSAWLVAIMFSLYELAGVATNLAAGLAGARWGIRATLLTGLGLQLAGISVLYAWQASWGEAGQQWKGLVFVTCSQALCGVAKDLVKLGGKTVTRLITPDEKQSQLFRLVSLITGWKNSMKGVGYFIGAAALNVDYRFALGLLLALILLAIPPAALGLSPQLGRTRSKNVTLGQLLRPSASVARLSLARAFLFGSRDLWFEVPLPFFIRDVAQGIGWPRPATGAVLAAFIIIYGQVQSWTPQLVLTPLRQTPANKAVQVLWNAALTAVPAGMAAALLGSHVFEPAAPRSDKVALLLCGLAVFCVLFAINSAIHSYLIVRYAGSDKVAATVGVYYASNAVGRFVGTLVSGALYEFSSRSRHIALGYCFVASAACSLASTLLTLRIDDQEAGLACGPCLTCVKPALLDRGGVPDTAASGGKDDTTLTPPQQQL